MKSDKTNISEWDHPSSSLSSVSGTRSAKMTSGTDKKDREEIGE